MQMPNEFPTQTPKQNDISQKNRLSFAKVMKERKKSREFKREKRQVNKRETSVNTRGKFIIVRGITTFKKPRDEKLMEQSENC